MLKDSSKWTTLSYRLNSIYRFSRQVIAKRYAEIKKIDFSSLIGFKQHINILILGKLSLKLEKLLPSGTHEHASTEEPVFRCWFILILGQYLQFVPSQPQSWIKLQVLFCWHFAIAQEAVPVSVEQCGAKAFFKAGPLK